MLKRMTKGWETVVNTSFIESIEKVNDKRIKIVMASGKIYEREIKDEETVEIIMTAFLEADQTPSKVAVAGLANIIGNLASVIRGR